MLSCNSHKHISPSTRGLSSILQNQLGVALDALTSRREGKTPPNLFQFGLLPKGGAPSPCGLVCFLLMAHKAHNFSRGVPVTSRYSRKMPEPLKTFAMSEYSLPIYRSLRLDHFETPRHVPDLIRNSELLWVHQNT